MESTALSVGKSALSGALGYAGSAVAEEVALQLGVRDDQAFIRDELEMMQAFLMAAHDERDDNRVVRTWVKQVRDVAYDVEDSLQEFAVRLARLAWWRVACSLLDRRRVAKKMKELRAKVEDVSQRNIRYHLIKGSSSKSARGTGQSTMAGGAVEMSGAHEVNRQRDQAKVDLARLINRKDDEVRVIGVCGKGGDLKETSILRRAYEDLKARKRFKCYAWISLVRPFSPAELLQSIVEQFYVNFLQEARQGEKATVEGQALRRMGMVKGEVLIEEFKRYVNDKSYLIVLDDLHTIEEWNGIKAWFPNNKKGSRIIVCADKVGVASLCVGPADAAPEHKQLVAADKTLYAFYEKGSQDGTDSLVAGSSSIADTTASNIYQDNKILPRTETKVATFKESQLTGRGKEKSDVIKLIGNEDNQQLEVISVWGMGGLGKTTLVRDIYQSQQLSGKFEKRACITIMRPFNLDQLLKSLASQLGDKEYERKADFARILEGKKFLIVLDDLSSTNEWDEIIPYLSESGTASRIIVTTRIKSIAKHCSKKPENIYHLQCLGDKDARNLFTEKVFNKITDLDEQYPELVEQANLVLKKCSGLPLAIVTIGGFLANQPKTVLVWRKLNEHISAELEMNQELETIRMVLIKSYDGLPYHLKSCFLYLSIFPEDYKIGWRRLVRRWTAEGYAREVRGKSAEEIAESYFMELISRSMLLPCQESIHSRKEIDSCQLHDHIREIGISKSMEENLVLRLEQGCSSNMQATVRHLAVSGSWEGDQHEFESMMDMSRLRSLTVFGPCRTFFISDKMKLLRVLDLEDSYGVTSHDLRHIGKLLHLRYLSVRGCRKIYLLPNSMGNLRQLHTLDARDTEIFKLPKSIVKLRKLKYLHAGSIPNSEEYRRLKGLSGLALRALYLACLPFVTCLLCCVNSQGGPSSVRDIWTVMCCLFLPRLVTMKQSLGTGSVLVPRGVSKLRSVHTLGIVDISRDKDILLDISRLTQLRKLRVDGINKRNYQAFRLAIADLKCLESLSIRSDEEQGLCGRLNDMYSDSESVPNLQSLKLSGNLVKLPQWIEKLKNLVKLKLLSSCISEVDDTMEVLGKLPNLAILCLWNKSFVGEEIRFSFHREAFRSLLVLEVNVEGMDVEGKVKSVKFEEGAAPKLELLKYRNWRRDAIASFSGLPHLPSLKQVLIRIEYNDDEFIKDLQGQLARNPNLPVLKEV